MRVDVGRGAANQGSRGLPVVARLATDTVHGVRMSDLRRFAIPVTDVARVEAKRFDARRTRTLTFTVVGMGLAAWGLWELLNPEPVF